MSAETISPTAAAEAIGEGGEAIYVDVRTVAEFATGRPKGRAVNLPIVFHHPQGGDPHANEAFDLVARHALEGDTPLIVGASMDARADTGAQALRAAGFEKVQVMGGGMDAWQAEGLPVTRDNREGVSYVSLLTAARRAK